MNNNTYHRDGLIFAVNKSLDIDVETPKTAESSILLIISTLESLGGSAGCLEMLSGSNNDVDTQQPEPSKVNVDKVD